MTSAQAPEGVPCTQIIYLTITPDKTINSTDSEAGKIWSKALDLLESIPGFQRMYWGRSPEAPSKVQLHIVRDTHRQHRDFLASPSYSDLLALLQRLIDPNSEPLVRHAFIREMTPKCQSLGKGAPFTGTAIYVGTDAAWHEGAWPLWTHVVRYVKGCMGCAGGEIIEPVDGYENNYIVYVGWESIKAHQDYHHTKHFADHKIILLLGNQGFREYRHVTFDGSREKATSKL